MLLNDAGSPCGLLDMGVRIFPDGRNPKDKTSLAAKRRLPRSMRRNRDRYLQRREKLLNALTRLGLMPGDEAARTVVARKDPYCLRAAAFVRPLTPHELGRVVFHLNQHRGFKSNRKTDRASNEGGMIADAGARTRATLVASGHPTIGSWLAARHAGKEGVRVRLAGTGKLEHYPFYPLREMVAEEFDLIWSAQAARNPDLTDAIRDELRDIVFHQRALKAPVVGRCWLEPEQNRAPRALPSAQRFRIAQTVANLRIAQPGMAAAPLTDGQRATLLETLYGGRDMTLDQIRKRLRLDPETDFNTREEKLTGCATAARLGNGKKAPIGDTWHLLDLKHQDACVRIILGSDSDDEAIEALIASGISPASAAKAAGTVLADGLASFSSVAMAKILPYMEQGSRYDEAVIRAGYKHHSDRRTGEIRDRLPYYGEILFDRIGTGSANAEEADEKRYGKAPNPTVHVALNELRRVVNAITDRHGAPTEIVIETLRDIGRSKKQREAYEAEQKKNRAANDDRRTEIVGLELPVTGHNMSRLRLWQEQASDPKNRVCPYTGKQITARMALSDEVEEDHILPFAVSLDDSMANRLLISREANRAKARRAPHEAFGYTPEWPAILERVALLPSQKKWRFQPDALEKYAREGDFLARHLGDSATIARWAKDYLEVLAPGKVWSTPGRLTALLRRKLGLNPDAVFGEGGRQKNRADHRHHVLDAVVVALTDRYLLQRATVAAKRAEESGNRLMVELEPPWDRFVRDVAERAAGLVVSHKPDIGWQDALHNDSAYGMIQEPAGTNHNLVIRRPIVELVGADTKKFSVRDPKLRARVETALASSDDKTAQKGALVAIRDPAGHVVRRLRTTERLEGTQKIADRRTGRPYKAVKRDGNHRVELWRLPSGAVKLTAVSTFEAAQQAEAARLGRKRADTRPHPAAKLLLTLHKNDMIAVGTHPARTIYRVVKMRDGQITLAPHQEAGNLKARDADRADPFKYSTMAATRLNQPDVRKIFVTPDGRVWNGDRRG